MSAPTMPTARRDLQEADLAHLAAASQAYDELAHLTNWVTIECFDAASSALRPRRRFTSIF